MNNKNMSNIQYIYLLHKREFLNTNKTIYKLGRTCHENLTRYNQYPKGSKLLFQMICSDCKNLEQKLLLIFRKEFKECKDIGNEYFDGHYMKMIDIIYNNMRNECSTFFSLGDDSRDISEENDDYYNFDNHNKIKEIKTYKDWQYARRTYDQWEDNYESGIPTDDVIIIEINYKLYWNFKEIIHNLKDDVLDIHNIDCLLKYIRKNSYTFPPIENNPYNPTYKFNVIKIFEDAIKCFKDDTYSTKILENKLKYNTIKYKHNGISYEDTDEEEI